MSIPAARELYKIAKEYILREGFEPEVAWQATRDFGRFDESDLLRESAWVILCSGFREATIRRCFSFISLCFYDWESSSTICGNSHVCKATAFTRFRNEKKIEAILQTSAHIQRVSFPAFKRDILQEPLQTLRLLPFVGDITAYHLAKNLGVEVAKPDRHLMRLASSMGFGSPQELCADISQSTGDPISVVDLILWRYLERGRPSPSEVA